MKYPQKVVCVDLDGTLCDDSHRHYLTPQLDASRTWAEYHMACMDDTPIMGTVVAVKLLAHDYGIYIISGREESARDLTVTWLEKYGIPYDELRLRQPQDAQFRKWEYKARYIEHLRGKGLDPVLFIEDWPMIARRIETAGVPVICINSRFPKLYNLPHNQVGSSTRGVLPVLTEFQLNEVAVSIAEHTLRGYPAPQDRLFSDSLGFHTDGKQIHVPFGPWHVSNHPNREGAEMHRLDPDLQNDVDILDPVNRHAKGYTTDQLGRPLHPYWKQLLADKRIGLPTGLGMFYYYGPNIMVDSIVYRWRPKLEILLIRQKETGKWGLPGGFMDATDQSFEAGARRELSEETGLHNIAGSAETIWYSFPLRQRDTLNAWAEVAVVLLHGTQSLLDAELVAGDDADEATWFSVSAMTNLKMLDTHMAYIVRAFPRMSKQKHEE